jgi:phosphohistidine phosphatase
MKKICMFRHGKSSWKYPVNDVYRPLNGRGLKQAQFMAQNCTVDEPDFLITSHASRAYSTALAYIAERNIPIEKLHIRWELYEGTLEQVLALLKSLPLEAQHVWIFGHNPSFNNLASLLLDELVGNIVTSAYVSLQCHVDKWSDLDQGCAQLLDLKRPYKKPID